MFMLYNSGGGENPPAVVEWVSVCERQKQGGREASGPIHQHTPKALDNATASHYEPLE